MADKIRVNMNPTTLFLTPSGNGNFRSSNATSRGAFPVVTGVQLSLDQRNAGTMPVVLGSPKPAVIELWARLKDPNNATAAYTLCGKLGATAGKLSLLSTGLRFEASIKNPKDPNSNVRVAEYTPDSAVVITRSDFLLKITPDGSTVQFPGDPLEVQLPWVFDGRNNIIQLNARIVVAGQVEVDITGPNANQPIDIPLQHNSVPDDGVPNSTTQHPLLTFFGVQHLYTQTLLNDPVRPKVPFAGKTLNVWLDSSVNSLIPAANLPQLSALIIAVLNDLGFGSVKVDGGTAATAEFLKFFSQVRSSTQAPWFFSNRMSPANAKKNADASEAGQPVSAISTDFIAVPFFDFFVVSEAVDPPAIAPDELGHTESISVIAAAGPTKSVASPIVLTAGSNALSGLRHFLSSIGRTGVGAEQAIVVSQVICHEIGHSLGLRHSINFPNALPYAQARDKDLRGVMGAAGVPPAVPAGTQPTPFQFFGPVNRLTIAQWYL
jgi:hypothetical protein